MITGVILNWKRPVNVERILAGWRAGGLVTEAIVWNNNADASFRHAWAKVINAGQDLGLYTRFAAACLARNECLLIQDDDLELPVDSLRRLWAAWNRDREILHGVFGRVPKSDGSYARDVEGDAEVPIVLTRALAAPRRYAAEFFQVAPAFDEIQRDSHPAGNGEDILFSYVARRESGRLNRVHAVAVNELPSPHSIHLRNRKDHIAHRTRLLWACEAWLQGTGVAAGRDLLSKQPTASTQTAAAPHEPVFAASDPRNVVDDLDGALLDQPALQGAVAYLRRGFAQGCDDYKSACRRRGWWKTFLPRALIRAVRKWLWAVVSLVRNRRRVDLSLAALPAAIAMISAYYASYALGDLAARFRRPATVHSSAGATPNVVTLPFTPREDATTSAKSRRTAA